MRKAGSLSRLAWPNGSTWRRSSGSGSRDRHVPSGELGTCRVERKAMTAGSTEGDPQWRCVGASCEASEDNEGG
jgi:hypothetical protein